MQKTKSSHTKHQSNTTNPLLSLFEGFSASAVKFREKVCEECGWSESTFYKRLRQKGDNKTIFSIAEIEK